MIDFGLTPLEFRTAYFEREPHLFRGALVERPYVWADVDRLLHVIEPSAAAVRMFHQGPVPEHAFTEDIVELGRPRRRLNKAKFYGYLENGATLVIDRFESYSVAAMRLCLEVGRFARAQTTGNAYVSFSGRGTFGKHWDTHDVFAIQLIGRKRWQLFAPTLPLPLSYQTSERSGQTCPAEPVLDVMLEEGDVLYVPRGWWHLAIPQDVGSLHFSAGTYAPTVLDYFVQTSARYLEQQVAARRAFSPADYREALTEMLQQLPTVLLDPEHAAQFERNLINRERLNAEFNLGLFLDSAASPLSAGAVLCLTTSQAPKLERGELAVNGAQLRLDPTSLTIVAALRDGSSVRFDALCARLSQVPPEVLRRHVLDLARHDIVTIQEL
jgi:ribosomal protein L16 Arg81 hydroxylase